MTPEENKAVLRRMFDESLNTQNYEIAAQFLTSDFVRHDVFKVFPDRSGQNGVKEYMSLLRAAIPDLRVDIVDILAEGDRVCVRYLGQGTHVGELLGRPGTGKPVRLEGVNVYRMVDGKIAETWQYMDGLGFLRLIGALPDLT
ncbi:MAG: ester cyclase [Polyangiaceae bacterium]|nr:ester cyclase [Polyangiaceae bacterium]